MKTALLIAATLAVLTAAAHAADPAAGRKVAGRCQACHGIDGIARLPVAPNLAGENSTYIAAQLQAFKDGTRKNEMMTVVAQGLSEAEIADVAAWYESIEVTVKLPDQR